MHPLIRISLPSKIQFQKNSRQHFLKINVLVFEFEYYINYGSYVQVLSLKNWIMDTDGTLKHAICERL